MKFLLALSLAFGINACTKKEEGAAPEAAVEQAAPPAEQTPPPAEEAAPAEEEASGESH